MPQKAMRAAKRTQEDPKVSELRERVNTALKQTVIAHLARGAQMNEGVLRQIADGTYTPSVIEIRHLEKGLACFE